MSITPGHLVLNTLQDLSRAVSRAGARDPSKDFTRVIPNPSKAYALGGLGIATSGKSTPGPIRYGAITITPQQIGPILGKSSSVHPAVGRAYDNPGVRFGDRSRGSSRPLSADGAQSFHFDHDHHSKTSSILQMIKATHGGRRYTNSKATDHLLYIERDGAAEKIANEKEYPGYDPDVADDPFWEIKQDAAGRTAQSQQDYLERPGAVERTPIKNLTDEELDALEYASFGTIGDTLDERRRFWDVVDQIEKEPRGDTLTLEFADNPEWWDLATSNIETAPRPLQAKFEQQRASGEIKDIRLGALPTDKAFAIHQWAVALYPEAPIDISPGRGGRVQNRIIAELPWELKGRERVEIVRNFTNKLTEKGLPFWAVIHAPDQNNDRRNYHVHIVYYDRPAARMKDPANPRGPDVWDFEIKEEKRFPNRHRRIVHPYLQNKLREANGQAWIPMLREHWAKVSNEVMEKAGVIKRYDARSYEAMGIQLDPLKHIHSKTFNKERKGELTEDGVVLARRQWQIMQDRLVADHTKRGQHRTRKLKEKTETARQVMGSQSPYKDIALKEVDRLTKLIERVGYRISTKELFQDLSRLVVDRVASRPKLIIDADKKKNEKSPGRTKSKGGHGHGQTTQAPEDKNGATPPVGRAAKEAMTFLLEVFGHAVHMDRRTGAEIQIARSQLNVLLTRLDNMMADPKRHPLDRRSPGFIDLDVVDPGPEVMAARKQERMERITNRLSAYVEAAVPKILAEVTGRSPSKPEPIKENVPPVSVPAQPSVARAEPASREPILVNRESSRAPSDRAMNNHASQLQPSAAQPAPARTANAETVQMPVSARPEEKVARPQKTRFRPEPFYKPKEKVAAPTAAVPTKNPAAPPVKSPAQSPISSAAKAPAPNNPRAEAVNKPVVAENSRQPAERASNVPKPENTAPGTKPIRDNAGPAVSKPAAAAPAPSAPAAAQRPVPAPNNAKPVQTQPPPRPEQASAVPAARPTVPQAGSTKEPASAKPTSAPAAAPAPAKPPSQAPVRASVPRPETARPAPSPTKGSGKPDTAKMASGAKTAARLEKASVAPKPSTAPSGPARIPGERSGENPAVKAAKEEIKIRVGNPISPVASKPIEPIRVEEKKQPKKPKRRIKGRDDGLEV